MHYEVKLVYWPLLFLIDCFGNVFFFWTKFFNLPKAPKKILVVRFDHAGDMIITSPLFRALKNAFPGAELSVLCRPFVKDLVITNKFVDAVNVLDVPWFRRDSAVGWFDCFKFLLALRRQNFDLVFELHGDPRNIFAAFLVGGYRVGFGVRGFGFLLNKVVDFSAEKQVVDRTLDAVRAVGVGCNDSLELFLTNDDEECANNLLKKNKIKSFILVHPVSGRVEKQWFVDSWSKLCDALVKKYALPIIITGAGSESVVSQEIIAGLSESSKKFVFDFCGSINNLRLLGALCRKSRLIVSTDTVVVHMARVFNRKCVVLYGSTDHFVWGYENKNFVSVYKKLSDSCSVDCRKESHRMNMMKEITVGDVSSAVERLL